MNTIHTFHIPVMGLAFTIDTPIKVAHYGIDSALSIVDDELIERMNAFYSKKFNLPYKAISSKVYDYRAKRITNYLNLVQTIVQQKFTQFKKELLENTKMQTYFSSILPQESDLRKKLEEVISGKKTATKTFQKYINSYLHHGAIDVNIMTKVDKENYKNGELLPIAFNDAHASLRGFANSNLNSSVILSAGMNPKLYSYIEEFDDFYPDQKGNCNKKITLKVSDFRSAQIQSRFLAQKGLWVSEFRIESGLNCGGHAFASDGALLGPILEEFKQQRESLINTMFSQLCSGLERKDKIIPKAIPSLKITVQGGVGTAKEHQFLLNYYKVNSVGWGSPFLLVKEATAVDDYTRILVAKATKTDLYLSNISPLGVPFNAVKNTTNEQLKTLRISQNRPGSSCPKKYLALHTLNNKKQVCTASRSYQKEKLKALEKENLPEDIYKKQKAAITEKSCLCVGLANASYISNHMPIKGETQGVVVCPGPNIAYFDKEVSLQELISHIYGKTSVLNNHVERPNFFIKELELNFAYYKKLIEEIKNTYATLSEKKLKTFKNQLLTGIAYYKNLFHAENCFKNQKPKILDQLEEIKLQIEKQENILAAAIL
ncbi:hypothetical protein ACG2LH_12365 [Zhouia sp. PK063]|uniref:hypothetical protein n=1 Tax=Zhouia sp. PK063 TaxID=3373602 RepID=UPI00379CA580